MPTPSHPETLGVFTPVNHVMASFPDASGMEGAAAALVRHGWNDADLARYSPEEMKAQTEADLAKASPLANLGQEINLARAHRELAKRGYSFLVVPAKTDALAQQVADISRQHGAQRAQRYGNFIIEELIDVPGQDRQVFESPDRGLDA